MGTGTLVSIGTSSAVDATGDQLDQYKAALGGDVIPRNTSGVATDQGGSLGSSTYQWYNLYLKNSVIQDGNIIDFSNLTGNLNQIVSGEAQSDGRPSYMTVITSTAGAFLDTQTTDFQFIANGTSKVITSTSSITFTGLTLATSSTANQVLVNNTAYSGSLTFTKTEGEHGAFIEIDNIGASVSSLDQTIQVFKNTTSGEYFLTFVDTTGNKLIPIHRGIGSTSRGALNNNEILALMKTTYLFLNVDGATTYTTLNYPKYLDSAPGSPASGDWYYDTTANQWYRYSGAAWVAINAIMVGYAFCDFGACAGVETMDFDKAWKDDFEGQVEYLSATKTRIRLSKINVAGTNIEHEMVREIDLDLSATGDRESGVSEAASTLFYIYCDKNGKFRYSDVCPRPKDKRKGFYHPKYYWRCIGTVYNDSGSNMTKFLQSDTTLTFNQNGTGSADTVANTSIDPTIVSSGTASYVLYEAKMIPPFIQSVYYQAGISVAAEFYIKARENAYGYSLAAIGGGFRINGLCFMQNATIQVKINGGYLGAMGYPIQF